LSGFQLVGQGPRVDTPPGALYTTTQRWFSLLDDIVFDDNGVPAVSPPSTTFTREGRYSWAYWLRMPTSGAANNAPVDLSVIVFLNRALSMETPASAPTDWTSPYPPWAHTYQYPTGERVYPAWFFPPGTTGQPAGYSGS